MRNLICTHQVAKSNGCLGKKCINLGLQLCSPPCPHLAQLWIGTFGNSATKATNLCPAGCKKMKLRGKSLQHLLFELKCHPSLKLEYCCVITFLGWFYCLGY